MRIMLGNLFENCQNIRNTENNKATYLINKKPRFYLKRGPEKLNQINLIYDLAMAKKNTEYIGKLSDILYNCKNIKNYPFKRINLDQAIYKINKNNELYLTLPNFLQNHRANTIETKNNKTKIFKQQIEGNWKMNKIFDRNTYLNQSIHNSSTDKKEEIPEEMRKNIYNDLKNKYNFETDKDEFTTLSKSPSGLKLFPKINNNFRSVDNFERSNYKKKESRDEIIDQIICMNKKTLELNSLKTRNHNKIINSPIFYLKKNHSVRKNVNNKNIDDIKINLKNNNGKLLKKMQSEINEIKNYVN